MIIGFGLIAQAVLLLVGPVFVPFLVVPKMDWLFWGWFKAFLQYSFYQVVASALVYIFGKLQLAKAIEKCLAVSNPHKWPL